jgi:hypothetical protein
MKTLPPDERVDKLTDIAELVALKLSSEVLGE